jgi:hypothetical protein
MPAGLGPARSTHFALAAFPVDFVSEKGRNVRLNRLVPHIAEGRKMVRRILNKQMERYKDLIYSEADYMKGFMVLIMKPKNTGLPWTHKEIRAIKTCIRHLAHYVPFLVIFLLPFGSLLLPVMAEVLDRRRTRRG